VKSLRYAAAALALAPWAAHADTIPNSFAFVDKSNVQLNTVVTSAKVAITGIDAPTPVSVSGGSYSIGCTATYVTTAGSINNGQNVCLRHTTAASPSTTVNTVLTVGGVSDTFSSTTLPPDDRPAVFNFLDETGVTANTVFTSRPVTITGINVASPVSVTGGSYSVGCTTTYITAAGTVNNGQTVCARHTTGATAGAVVTTKLTVGGVVDNFSTIVADNSNPKASMLPYGTGLKALKLYNPLKPFSVSNPVTVATALPPEAFDDAELGFAVDVSGSMLSNIRLARLATVRTARIIAINLAVGQNSRPVTLSSITDACRLDSYVEDVEVPTRSRLMVQRKGADAQCDTGDDVNTVILANAGLADAGITPVGLKSIHGILGNVGQLVGFLTIEGSPQLALVHRDANFATPVTIMNLANSGMQTIEAGLTYTFVAVTPQGQTLPRLYRYDNAANGTTVSAALYNFLNSSVDGEDATYDSANIYFADGNRVLRTPFTAAGTANTAIAATLAAGQQVSQLRLSSFASTRLVFSSSDIHFTGGIYSLLKTATAGTPQLLQASNFSVGIAQFATLAKDFAYVNVVNFGSQTVSALRIGADGNNATTAANAYWAGAGINTSLDMSLSPFDSDVSYVLKGTKGAGADTVTVTDPATGNTGITLGNVNNPVPMQAAFAFGDGRYGQLVAVIDRGGGVTDADGYFYDAQTANSLKALTTTAGVDDPTP